MKRTGAITAAVGLAGLQTLLLMPLLLDMMVSTRVGPGSRVMCAIFAASLIVSVIGFWQMKKQGLYAYLTFATLSQLYFISMDSWSVKPFVLSLIIIVLGASSFNEME